MLFYVSYDCNRAKVWYEGDLAVIKRKRKEIFMKKIVILTLIFAGFTLSANAQSTFSTFTPFTPQQAYKFNSNLYDRYLPPNKQRR